MENVKRFKEIAIELGELYEAKNKCYSNSFGDTYKKLGIVSAVTRISDKYNRLCNLATNPDIDNLGESIDDTLRDMAAYCIMTLIELEKAPSIVNQEDAVRVLADIYHIAGEASNRMARETLDIKSLNELVNKFINVVLNSKVALPAKNE